MTITYQKNVQNTSFMGFAKLLFKWRGSIYKLVFKELIMYGSAFAVISVWYRFYMTEEQKRDFEKVALYCNETAGLMPMSFVLGFYVTFVVTRWWNQFLNMPWPDRLAHTILLYMGGSDERGRVIRRTLVRYINLTTVLLFQTISGAVKKRFPTISHLVEAGIMTSEEKQMLENVDLAVNKHWVPLVWCINLINVAAKEGRIQAGEPIKQFLNELNSLRTKTGHLWGHDWVTVPLVYTQVVTLLTHLFFLTCLVGRQFLDPAQGYPGHDVDLYFPVYTFLQFFFFLGWLKVAEQLINPFGEDDDDFETNWFIDRNIKVCYTIVDDMFGKIPRLEKDSHWGNNTVELPYTEASLVHKIPDYKGSTMNMIVPVREQVMVFQNSGEHILEEPEPEPEPIPPSQLKRLLSRFCCRCRLRHSPPMNKSLGESYGRTEPMNFENYDNPNNRKVSSYSIFEDGYFNLINKSGKRGSTVGELSVPHATSETSVLMPPSALTVNYKCGKRGSDPGHLSVDTSVTHNRRHRPSAIAGNALSSVCELEQEENESDADTVKMALAFLDEDLEDVVTEK